MSGTEIVLECGHPVCTETFATGRSLWKDAEIEGREAGWQTDQDLVRCPEHRYPNYPEHEKLAFVSTEVRAVLEFIHEALDRDREPIPDELVYSHWGVDYDKIKQEREQMLQAAREEEE